jgi:homospermidine synthase
MTDDPKYRNFHATLEYDYRREKPQSKEELRKLMRDNGYRVKGKGDSKRQVSPTEKQLNHAWNYLKGEGFIQEIIKEFIQREIKYSWGTSLRKTVPKGQKIKIGNKIYKGGQFLPSDYE